MCSSVGKLPNHDYSAQWFDTFGSGIFFIEKKIKNVLASNLWFMNKYKKPYYAVSLLSYFTFGLMRCCGCDVFTCIYMRWRLSNKPLQCLKLVSVVAFRFLSLSLGECNCNGCAPACFASSSRYRKLERASNTERHLMKELVSVIEYLEIFEPLSFRAN